MYKVYDKRKKVDPPKLRKGQKCWLCKKEISGGWCYNGFHYFCAICKNKDTTRRIKKYLKGLRDKKRLS